MDQAVAHPPKELASRPKMATLSTNFKD